jgi:predicted transcriptional regulator of viral defense system
VTGTYTLHYKWVKWMEKILQKLEVVNTHDVADHLGITKEHASVLLHRLTKEGIAEKVIKGLYYIKPNRESKRPPNRYLVASKIQADSVLCYHSALELHGLSHQQFYTVFVHSAKRFNPFTFKNIRYHHVQLKDPDFEVEEVTVRDFKIRTTRLERTILDCSQKLRFSGGWEELYHSLDNNISVNPLRVFSNTNKLYNSKLTYRKMGFLFDLYYNRWNFNKDLYQNMKNIILTKMLDYEELKRLRVFSETFEDEDLITDSEWNIKYPAIDEAEEELVW